MLRNSSTPVKANTGSPICPIPRIGWRPPRTVPKLKIDCLSTGVLVADHLCDPISHLPAAGELVLSERLPLEIGGCAANVAMDLAKLGVRVGVLGCVGHDPFGAFVRDTLAARGVDVSGIRVEPSVPTSGTLIVNVRAQDRRFIHSIGANASLAVAHIPIELVRQSRVLYVGGYLLLPGMDQDELARLFSTARASRVTTVLDVVLPGPGDHWSRLERLLPHTDVFLPNHDESVVITGLKDPLDQARRFREAGARTVVITCGGDGAVLVSDDCRLRAGVYPLPFVGGTGAGDAFDAGFIAGLLAGDDFRRCLEWGSILGASCVRAIGATEGVFNRAEAEDFMRRHPLRIVEI